MKRGIVAALLASTGFAGTAAASPALDWQSCAENASVQCASLTVPINWAKPAAETIDVAVARRPATLVSPEVAARFDLVSFDPRGTNRGNPVTCDATLIHERPNMIPETGARLTVVLAHNKKLGASCRAHTGPLIDYIDNDSVARDIDALRAGIGSGQRVRPQPEHAAVPGAAGTLGPCVLDRTECTRAAVDNYLLDGTLPGAHCPIGNAMSQISSSGAAEAKSAR